MTPTLLPSVGPARSIRRPRRRLAPEPLLSAVIVNYKQWEATAALARQVVATPAGRRGAVEVVVVDNHSPSHSLATRLRRWPGVSLRRWGRNRGFARAANEAGRLSRGRWLLLLNPDVTLGEGFLDGVLDLTRRLEARADRVGVVGFRLDNGDGTVQLSAGPFPTFTGTLARMFLPRRRRKYTAPAPARARRVAWVTGCCWLLRRDCLEDVGGFDEDYFLYYEDVDFCRRARSRGWSVWYQPALGAVHHGPLHGRPVSPTLRVCTRHALLTYASKHWPAAQFLLLARLVSGEAWARQTWARLRGRGAAADRFAELRAIAREMAAGRAAASRRRLDRIVRGEEPGGGP